MMIAALRVNGAVAAVLVALFLTFLLLTIAEQAWLYRSIPGLKPAPVAK